MQGADLKVDRQIERRRGERQTITLLGFKDWCSTAAVIWLENNLHALP